jgi:hypothetical protein
MKIIPSRGSKRRGKSTKTKGKGRAPVPNPRTTPLILSSASSPPPESESSTSVRKGKGVVSVFHFSMIIEYDAAARTPTGRMRSITSLKTQLPVKMGLLRRGRDITSAISASGR